jgi:Tfp pilus assembly protein PilF
VLLSLIQNLLTSREDREALEIAVQADRHIIDAPTAPPFDEAMRYHSWILNAKASALRHLGRFAEAEAELRRAVDLAAEKDAVSHKINLADFLCELNRPDEALRVLPQMDQASDYGKTQIVIVKLLAAKEQEDAPTLQQQLDYLRDHQQVSPDTYERGLLAAAKFDKAEELVTSRLADPATRTDALVRVQVYAQSKLPPTAQTWQLEREKLSTAPNVLKAVALVGSVSHYTWRYD